MSQFCQVIIEDDQHPDGVCGNVAHFQNEDGRWLCAECYDIDVDIRRDLGGGLVCRDQFDIIR